MTDWLALLNVISLIVGVGVPVGTIVYQAGIWNQWAKGVEVAHKECKEERVKNECELFERLSQVEQTAQYQKGRMKGRMNGKTV